MLHYPSVILEIKMRKMTGILSLMERTMGLVKRFLRKRKIIISIKEVTILFPRHLALQGTLEDLPSLSRNERVTKTRKFCPNSQSMGNAGDQDKEDDMNTIIT